jgi:hypothetical protein
VKALSLWQPWATLVAIGAKRIETRHWATSYRGPLAIHAAKKWDRELAALSREPEFEAALREASCWPPESLPFGAIVCTAELYHCGEIVGFGELGRRRPVRGLLDPAALSKREAVFGNYEPGRFAWGLQNVRRLVTPIPFRGAQGLFEVPDALIESADFELTAEQLARALR